MKYTFHFEHLKEGTGNISLQRMETLAKALNEVAERSLKYSIAGMSKAKFKKPYKYSLDKALNIKITGQLSGSTILEMDAPLLENVLNNIQLNLFNSERWFENESVISLAVETMDDASKASSDNDDLHFDDELLNSIQKFGEVFHSDQEKLRIQNQGSLGEKVFNRQKFSKITNLQKSIPKPKIDIVSGTLDELKYSKEQVKIKTKEGQISGQLANNIQLNSITKHFGKNVTIQGEVHFKSNGKPSHVFIHKLYDAAEKDVYFNRIPHSETAEEQLQRQLIKNAENPLTKMTGKWPGNESDDEFWEMLKHLD